MTTYFSRASQHRFRVGLFALLCTPTAYFLPACDSEGDSQSENSTEGGVDPESAQKAVVDRFSMAAGKLMVRTPENELPGPGVAVDFDVAPFITHGLSATGEPVRYYNFDVQSPTPAPVYRLYRATDGSKVAGQLDIFSVLPGQAGYSDFHQVIRVLVPDSYVANRYTSLAELTAAQFPMQETTELVNAPMVAHGSTASSRWQASTPSTAKLAWYNQQTVAYFEFETLTGQSTPTSPIYVMFNVNPDQPSGGPGSGFRSEDGVQTHNIVATVPGDASYSPLWAVQVLDNSAFDAVRDLASALSAPLLAADVALVNCPVVSPGEVPIAVPTTDGELSQFLHAGSYRSFPGEPAVHPSTGPHGGGVRTYLNPSLQASLVGGSAQHPVGAAAVKELYDDDALIGWAVLVKVQEDGPEDQRYYWFEELNNKVVISGRDKSVCTNCHSGGVDFVLTAAID